MKRVPQGVEAEQEEAQNMNALCGEVAVENFYGWIILVDDEKVGTFEEVRLLVVEESAGHHNTGSASFLVNRDAKKTMVGKLENIQVLVHRPILLAFHLQYYE